jgi:uncharacterized protein
MILQRNLSLLSNRLAREGGRRFREDVLERDYCLAWFLAALAESDLQPALAFKGGTALKRCYFGDYRFSEDLDFTLLEPLPAEVIFGRLDRVYASLRQSSGIVFAFDREDRQKHANSHTFYLNYVGPLPGGGDVKVDITIRERLAYSLRPLPVLRGYEEFADIPQERHLRVYSLEEIIAEKTMALADSARNEPRDLYDFWYLTSQAGVGVDHLDHAIQEKLAFRGKPCEAIEKAILRKEPRLRALWAGRLSHQVNRLPEFEEVFRVVRRVLRQANLP